MKKPVVSPTRLAALRRRTVQLRSNLDHASAAVDALPSDPKLEAALDAKVVAEHRLARQSEHVQDHQTAICRRDDEIRNLQERLDRYKADLREEISLHGRMTEEQTLRNRLAAVATDAWARERDRVDAVRGPLEKRRDDLRRRLAAHLKDHPEADVQDVLTAGSCETLQCSGLDLVGVGEADERDLAGGEPGPDVPALAGDPALVGPEQGGVVQAVGHQDGA